jgi:hypothetical protein
LLHLAEESAASAVGPLVSRIRSSSWAVRLIASSQVASRKALYHAGGVAARSRTSSSSSMGTPVWGGLPTLRRGGRGFFRSPISSMVRHGPSRCRGDSPVQRQRAPSWTQPFRMSGTIKRSRCIGKSYPNRPLTQVEPWLGVYSSIDGEVTRMISPSFTWMSSWHPTPQ